MIDFSVLMSLYTKETPGNLEQCFESLFNQTYQANEIIVVLDGPINEQLHSVINKWAEFLPLHIVPLPNNVGLGNALNIGMKSCNHALIARMDTDDICVPNRFELQIRKFSESPKLCILGGAISEFENDINISTGVRKVPETHVDILKYAVLKNPFNHMTVMFKKDEIMSVGGYMHHHFMEDYNLWLRVLSKGKTVGNIADILVYARTGNAMLNRRRGLSYIHSELILARLKHKLGFQNFLSASCILLLRSLPRLLPITLFRKIYSVMRKQ